jgi:carbon monoxide dehydrogenase subunit G
MSTVHASIEIAAPPERVWETIMDPDRLKDWVTIHRSVENVTNPGEKGATMDQVLHMRGVSFRVSWNLTDVQAPKVADWEGRGPARSRARIRYELTPQGDEGTVFNYTNEFTPPGGKLGSVASRVIVGAASEREANSSLKRLKALLERS